MPALQMLLARLGNIAARPRWLATRVTRLHARILRLSRGRLRRSLFLAGGQPVLVLTTKGRRTGRRRSTPVAYMRDGDELVIVPGNAGLRRPPAWWLNLQADPQAEVEVGGRSISVRARRAQPLEEGRLWPHLVRQFAGHEQTRRMARRDIPVVILQRSDSSISE